MLRLIEDLLDIERIAAGKLTLHIEQHDVSEIIKQSVEQLHEAAVSKGITLEAEPQDVSGYVVCDRSRVMQVLSNLIGNAIKFTPAEGKICVSRQRTGPEGEQVQISISDTGEGIAPDKIKTIFERFSQLHKQDRRGIAILTLHCKDDDRRTSGKNMGSVPKLGEGSTFHFTLPLRSGAIREAKPQ